jgi:excisionase family DNA binding protein
MERERMTNWLSGREAAKVLGVSYQTVNRWVTIGRLQPLGRVGKTFVFEPNYIQREADKLRMAKAS